MTCFSERVATLFGIGRIPYAPGTWGSLAATLLAPALFLPLSLPLRILALILLFFLGSWTATKAERICGLKDPGHVVIDELVGQWLTFLPLTAFSWLHLAAGFIFFRIFDILKPPPILRAETCLPDGYGMMIDDVLAGVYAALCLLLLLFFLG